MILFDFVFGCTRCNLVKRMKRLLFSPKTATIRHFNPIKIAKRPTVTNYDRWVNRNKMYTSLIATSTEYSQACLVNLIRWYRFGPKIFIALVQLDVWVQLKNGLEINLFDNCWNITQEYYFNPFEFFTPALNDDISLESEWQQVCSALQDFSEYSSWF